MNPNTFFEELKNTTPFFKWASQGFAGTGKTYTNALIAIGLHQRIKSTKPIVIFDTEMSAKFLTPLFEKHGIKALVKRSRTLPDLTATMKFCAEGNSDILLIDSITHVYEDYLESYKQKKGRSYLQFQDWGEIRPTWKREFSDRLVQSTCHIGFTGRQGYTYDNEIGDSGKREIVKSGVKMKAEGETAYEPDLLLMMERFEVVLTDKKEVWREATVLKDRANLIDGLTIKNPTFKDFEPVLNFLLSGVAESVDTESYPNEDLIKDEADNSKERQERTILLQRNDALLDKVSAGTSKDAKAMRLALMEYAYDFETSELAIAEMNRDQLRVANERLQKKVGLIDKINRGEAKVFRSESKFVNAARLDQISGDNLGDASVEDLEKYLKYLIEKAKGAAA